MLVRDASIGSEATFVAMLGNVVSARTSIGTRDDIFNASSVVDNLLVSGAYSLQLQLGVGRIALMMLQISSFGYIHTFISSSLSFWLGTHQVGQLLFVSSLISWISLSIACPSGGIMSATPNFGLSLWYGHRQAASLAVKGFAPVVG